MISREFDGVKPNPRSFSSDPISASDQDGIAIFLWGTELGICWTSRVKSHTSIQVYSVPFRDGIRGLTDPSLRCG
jgi:hypothetical protein